MAGITSDMLAGMLKTNLSNLKSFAEQLNAELTENAQEDNDRESQRRDISHILETFETNEAFFEKGRKCLGKVENEVKKSCKFDDVTSIDENAVVNEIKNMIHSLEGSMRLRDHNSMDYDSEDTPFSLQQVHTVKDILNDINHPLIWEEQDDDDYDGEEEHRAIQLLESTQKRESATDNDNDEDIVPSLNISDGSDANITRHSFERVENGNNNNTHLGFNNVDQLHQKYKEKLIQGSNVCPKQLYNSKIDSEAEVDPEDLPTLSKYKESILELFSKEVFSTLNMMPFTVFLNCVIVTISSRDDVCIISDAIVVVEKKQSYIDPISRTPIRNPVRNKICDHVYERQGIYDLLLAKKNKLRCPCLGCSCLSFSAADLVEDEELAERIKQSQARERQSMALANENSDTDSEVGAEDDTQSQEIL